MVSKPKHPFPEMRQPFSMGPDAKRATTISSAPAHNIALCDLIINDSTQRLASQTVAGPIDGLTLYPDKYIHISSERLRGCAFVYPMAYIAICVPHAVHRHLCTPCRTSSFMYPINDDVRHEASNHTHACARNIFTTHRS